MIEMLKFATGRYWVGGFLFLGEWRMTNEDSH